MSPETVSSDERLKALLESLTSLGAAVAQLQSHVKQKEAVIQEQNTAMHHLEGLLREEAMERVRLAEAAQAAEAKATDLRRVVRDESDRRRSMQATLDGLRRAECDLKSATDAQQLEAQVSLKRVAAAINTSLQACSPLEAKEIRHRLSSSLKHIE